VPPAGGGRKKGGDNGRKDHFRLEEAPEGGLLFFFPYKEREVFEKKVLAQCSTWGGEENKTSLVAFQVREEGGRPNLKEGRNWGKKRLSKKREKTAEAST